MIKIGVMIVDGNYPLKIVAIRICDGIEIVLFIPMREFNLGFIDSLKAPNLRINKIKDCLMTGIEISISLQKMNEFMTKHQCFLINAIILRTSGIPDLIR